MSRKFSYKLLAAAVLAASLPLAQAGERTSTMFVSLTVQDTCTEISTSSLPFGTAIVGTGGERDASTFVSVACNSGTNYQIGIDNGNSGSGERRLSNFSGDSVKYEIYRDSARSARWGAIGTMETVAGVGVGASQPIPVYGKVFLEANKSPGDYSDNLTVTLSF